MEKYQQNTEFPLDISSVEMITVRLVYQPLLTEYSAFYLDSETYSGNDTDKQPNFLDEDIERFRGAWEKLAEL